MLIIWINVFGNVESLPCLHNYRNNLWKFIGLCNLIQWRTLYFCQEDYLFTFTRWEHIADACWAHCGFHSSVLGNHFKWWAGDQWGCRMTLAFLPHKLNTEYYAYSNIWLCIVNDRKYVDKCVLPIFLFTRYIWCCFRWDSFQRIIDGTHNSPTSYGEYQIMIFDGKTPSPVLLRFKLLVKCTTTPLTIYDEFQMQRILKSILDEFSVVLLSWICINVARGSSIQTGYLVLYDNKQRG